MNTHADNLRRIEDLAFEGIKLSRESRLQLLQAADYIEAHEDAFNEYRRKADIQIALRVEAQARAGRLARDARR